MKLKDISGKIVKITVFLLPVILFAWSIMGPLSMLTKDKNIRAIVFLAMVGAGMLFGKYIQPDMGWKSMFAVTLISYASVYKLISFSQEISTYPWSLGWSEGSRYYLASLFFSNKVYGIDVSPSVLHPTRYLMQSLPFIFDNVPLWFHRFWQVSLWITFSLWAGIVIAKRFKAGWVFALFSALFMFEGPVYYHLLVMVIIVIAFTDTNHFLKTLSVVIIASIWAGISRVNWFPIPGMLAACLYFIEVPVEKKTFFRYFVPPAIWTLLGVGVAFLSQTAYVYFSGNPVEQFGSSFTSDLLWYRLLPNATYNLGLLIGVWRISFPIVLIVIARWLPNMKRYHPVRILGLTTIVLLLLAGGLVVSVKIGGGSNLHNLDGYLVAILVIGAAFYYHKMIPDSHLTVRSQGKLWPIVFFVLLFPIRDITQLGGPYPGYDFDAAQKDLTVLAHETQTASASGDEVLYIYQRHLLTTHIVENVTLVPDYELVFLMEMAMSKNYAYLNRFKQDLINKRFGIVVAAPQKLNYQDRNRGFSEENNAWVEWVSEPLLCYYQNKIELQNADLVLMVPRENPCE